MSHRSIPRRRGPRRGRSGGGGGRVKGKGNRDDTNDTAT